LVEGVDDDQEPGRDEDVDGGSGADVDGGWALEQSEDDDEGNEVPDDGDSLYDHPGEQQTTVFRANTMDENAEEDDLQDEDDLIEANHELKEAEVETYEVLGGLCSVALMLLE